MHQNQRALISWVLSLLVASAAIASAQRTVVENNGVGGRIETDYNAAGKATEMRTIGADGKLQQKADYEYLPGYYVAQQTDTSYWPNGHVHKLARHTYDESANFTGEFIQLFDDSGKQIAGHKLTHDPFTGVYRCSEWNAAAQNYRAVDCPAGEEEHGKAEQTRTFTYQEVMKNLAAARKGPEQKAAPSHPDKPGYPLADTPQRELGLLLPAHVRPGERISGTVVEDLQQYRGNPEVTVTRIVVPFASTGEASRLSGWWFETEGEQPRPADGPITLVVPGHASEVVISFREVGNRAHVVSQTLNLSQLSEDKSPLTNSFRSPALCIKGELCMVSGPFNGDSTKTFAAFEDRPAPIVAETSDAVYLRIPEPTEPGARPLFIAEGTKVIAIPLVVGKFFIKNNGRQLQASETLITFPTLDGPGDLPDSAWEAGNFPGTNLQRLQHLIPGFQLPPEHDLRERIGGQKKDARDEKRELKEEKEQGEILLIVQNATPEQISLRGSKNDLLIFHLRDEAFRRGEFKYDLVVEAKKAGKVDVRGYVIPLLAPIVGQEFSVKPAQ